MFKFLLRRLLNYAVLLIVAVTIAYILAGTQLDPRTMAIETELTSKANVNPEAVIAAVDTRLYQWNINPQTPVLERFVEWNRLVFTEWNWGYSPKGALVNEEIGNRIFISLQLVVLGFLIGIFGGVALGAWSAVHQYSKRDRVLTIVSMLIISTPVMVYAVFLQIAATWANQKMGIQFFEFIGPTAAVPPEGTFAQIVDRAQHLLLPTISMSLGGLATYSRYQRNLMLDTLGQDYVRTARAKGLRFGKAIRRHALRTSLIPITTYFAFGIATLILGGAVTEQVFGWQGMGIYGVQTIRAMDINGTVAVVAFSGAATLTGAFLSDLFIAAVDPRVRVS
ncbi:ABC transporter permease [Arcanobacterium bovis]|uniref:ABC transporter permease n=1 Tax=Arcanobacterium bovis TaxID=2529275 RepID=A0A4V2KRA5_9ACTO|nr:ABC transporter permease [Arcanobacterium bovis]TBW23664.1 ABC transporter permease [Arcanobacterium bovis]